MNTALLSLVIILAIIASLILISVIVIYNAIIVSRNRVENSWHQIDVQLRKRYDLIPNLVETVKGYARHEQETLEKVINARNSGIEAKNIETQTDAENSITSTLKSLFAVSERYPDLKADKHFLKLMEELNGIESNIAYARQFYNDMVMKFNTKIQKFPGNIYAGIFKFKIKKYFEIQEKSIKKPIEVIF